MPNIDAIVNAMSSNYRTVLPVGATPPLWYLTQAQADAMLVDTGQTFVAGERVEYTDPAPGGSLGVVCTSPGAGGTALWNTAGPITGGYYTPGGGGSLAISGINLVGSALEITGSGFGTKPGTAAPIYFQPFLGLTNGANISTAGIDYSDSSSPVPVITTAVGVGTGSVGSIVTHIQGLTQSAPDWASRYGIDLDTPVQEIFVNQWMRLDKVAGTLTNPMQIKGIRTGMTNDPDDGERYGTQPRLSGSTWMPDSGVWDTSRGDSTFLAYVPSTGGEVGNFGPGHDSTVTPYSTPNEDGEAMPFSDPPVTGWGQWYNHQLHHRLNDYGSANGFMSLSWGARERIRVANLEAVTIPGQLLGWVSFSPFFDQTAAADIDVFISRIYVDSTQARVFLGNAATIGACTDGHFMLPPTSWADGTINVTHCANMPVGYDWVYVVKSDGTVSNGFSIV